MQHSTELPKEALEAHKQREIKKGIYDNHLILIFNFYC